MRNCDSCDEPVAAVHVERSDAPAFHESGRAYCQLCLDAENLLRQIFGEPVMEKIVPPSFN